MKTVLAIWIVAVITVVGTTTYINSNLKAVPVETKPTILQATTSTDLQPYGFSYEDEYTATMAVQPADYSKQTTLHAYFIQDATARLQGTSPQLQAADTRVQ